MKHQILAPNVGESITEVTVLAWNKQDGAWVEDGEVLVEIESDKASVEVVAEGSGQLKILQVDGTNVKIGEILGELDNSVKKPTADAGSKSVDLKSVEATSAKAPAAVNTQLSPAVRKIVAERNLDPSTISGTGKGGRLTKGDVLNQKAQPVSTQKTSAAPSSAPVKKALQNSAPSLSLLEGQKRVPMSRLRAKIAQRLLSAQQNAAILSTFNEVDLSKVNELRKQYKEPFKAKHSVGLGYMSFFTRAVTLALKEIPECNAFVDGNDIIYNEASNVGIAVGTDKGLVVPVLKNAQDMTFLQIEKRIVELAGKARIGKLGIQDMVGGTFTITNGGVYGSLMSTPILNPPQSAILGMHGIKKRPIVDEDGQIVVRPMMYLALSYDHRLIDGKGAVTFLVKIKEALENPESLGLDFKAGL